MSNATGLADAHDARHLDSTDPVPSQRHRFALPVLEDGTPSIYFCGNSLGLQPLATAEHVDAKAKRSSGSLASTTRAAADVATLPHSSAPNEKAMGIAGARSAKGGRKKSSPPRDPDFRHTLP